MDEKGDRDREKRDRCFHLNREDIERPKYSAPQFTKPAPIPASEDAGQNETDIEQEKGHADQRQPADDDP